QRLADLEAEERAEHVEARVGEIEHAHHAEDEREPARHQEQQHAVEHAVEGGDDDELEHGSAFPSPRREEVAARSAAGEGVTIVIAQMNRRIPLTPSLSPTGRGMRLRPAVCPTHSRAPHRISDTTAAYHLSSGGSSCR